MITRNHLKMTRPNQRDQVKYFTKRKFMVIDISLANGKFLFKLYLLTDFQKLYRSYYDKLRSRCGQENIFLPSVQKQKFSPNIHYQTSGFTHLIVINAFIIHSLTHISLASFLWDKGKQNSSRCDAAKRGVPSGAILFA